MGEIVLLQSVVEYGNLIIMILEKKVKCHRNASLESREGIKEMKHWKRE